MTASAHETAQSKCTVVKCPAEIQQVEYTQGVHLMSQTPEGKKQPPEVFYKKGVLKNFAKFTRKHQYQSLFLRKLQALACNFIEKEILPQMFSYIFCKIFKDTFSTEHLRATVSAGFSIITKMRRFVQLYFIFHKFFLTNFIRMCQTLIYSLFS